MALKIVVGAAAVLAALYYLLPRGTVSSPEAHRLVEAGALLVDVRTRDGSRPGTSLAP